MDQVIISFEPGKPLDVDFVNIQPKIIKPYVKGQKKCPKCRKNRDYLDFYSKIGVQKYCSECRKLNIKQIVRNKVCNAIRAGKITRQPCENCGTTKRIHAHHEDYSKPFEINWLCFDCHMSHHGIFGHEKVLAR